MNDDISARCFFVWIAMIAGTWLGWVANEYCWRFHHVGGIHMGWNAPVRGLDYYLIAVLCMMAGAALGLALVRWRDLPVGENSDATSPGSQAA